MERMAVRTYFGVPFLALCCVDRSVAEFEVVVILSLLLGLPAKSAVGLCSVRLWQVMSFESISFTSLSANDNGLFVIFSSLSSFMSSERSVLTVRCL